MTDKKTPAKKPVKKPVQKSNIVKMERDGKLANVHIDEVDNYRKGGWIKC
ncbi:MAG: hypothetical protein ACSHXL_00750 [Bacteroidota bacterium]